MPKSIPSCYLDQYGNCRSRNKTRPMQIDLFHLTTTAHFDGIRQNGLIGSGFNEETVHQRVKDLWKYGDPTYPYDVSPSELSDETYEQLITDVMSQHGDRIFAGKQTSLYEMFEDAGARGLFTQHDPVLLGIKQQCRDYFKPDPVDLEWEWTAKNVDIPASCLVRVVNWKNLLKPQIKKMKNRILWWDLFREQLILDV